MPQADPDQVDQAEPIPLRSDRIALIRMFDAFRSRCESDRSWSDRISRASATVKLRIRARRASGARARQDVADVGRQADDVGLLDGDQVGLVRQEPEERVALERAPARQMNARFCGVGMPRLARCWPACHDRQARDGRNSVRSGSSHFLRLNRL